LILTVDSFFFFFLFFFLSWEDHEDFLIQLAIKNGRLLKKGEPDVRTAARMVLNDWQRGKLPYFTEPPKATDDPEPTKRTKIAIEEGSYTNGDGETLPPLVQDDFERLGNVSIFGNGVELSDAQYERRRRMADDELEEVEEEEEVVGGGGRKKRKRSSKNGDEEEEEAEEDDYASSDDDMESANKMQRIASDKVAKLVVPSWADLPFNN
jgi:nuclear GTP-binding protein